MSNLHKPNFTAVPNVVIDHWMAKLSHSEFKIIMYIFRQTTGFHRRSAYISYDDFEQKCGVSRKWVIECCKKLKKAKWLKVTDGNNNLKNKYEIIYSGSKKECSEVSTPAGEVSTPRCGEVSTPETPEAKERLERKKETNKQEPTAVAVFSCLKDLEIAEDQKRWISENHTEPHVEHAVKYVKHPSTVITDSLIAALKWACKAQPEIKEALDEEGNREFAKKNIKSKGERFGKYKIEVLSKGIEVLTVVESKKDHKGKEYACIYGTNVQQFNFDERRFKVNFMNFLKENIPSLHNVLKDV